MRSFFLVRRISFAMLLLFSVSLHGQLPKGFSYQAIARNVDGDLLTNTPLLVQFSLYSPSGTLIWKEQHSVTTNQIGQFTAEICNQNSLRTDGTAATLEDIDWVTEQLSLGIKIDDGSGLRDLGSQPLMSVPYALHAINDADPDPANEIQDLQLVGSTLSISGKADATPIDLSPFTGTNTDEQQLSFDGNELSISNGNGVDLSVLRDGTEDADADPQNEIQDLQLSGNEISLTNNPSATAVDLGNFNAQNVGWSRLGDAVVYAGGNVGVGTVTPDGRMIIQAVDESENEPLFMVKRKDGYPVFAIYEHGVVAYTDTVESVAGIKGGFAVGGYVQGQKGLGNQYMRVTADSIRFYVDPDNQGKGVKGGFAVGGHVTPYKNSEKNEFLRVTPDSVRIYIDQDPDAKGVKGGFAVGGYVPPYKKGANNDYFNISARSTAEIIPGENRLVWYPERNAFLTGNVLVVSPDSVGENSMAAGYQVQAKGAYSQAFGYKSVAADSFSIAIGKRPLASHPNSFAFGERARALNENTYAFGFGAEATGSGAVAIGSMGETGFPPTMVSTLASGQDAFALGQGAHAVHYNSIAMGLAAFSSGLASVSLGYETVATGPASFAAGNHARATGNSSISLGSHTEASGESSFAAGFSTDASGQASIAMGHNSGASGYFSTAVGYSDTASAWGSTALGYGAKSTGKYAVAAGIGTEARSYQSAVVGTHNIIYGDPDNWVPTDPIFVVGNGQDGANRSDAFRVLKNGTTEILGGLVAKSLFGTYINAYMLNDHLNGNVTVNALGQDLYMGYSNTQDLKFYTGTGSGTGTQKMTILANGNVGINTATPTERLHVNGALRVGDSEYRTDRIEIGKQANGDRYAFIDFIGDDTYDDYGLRLIRNPGYNAYSRLEHRGLGTLQLFTRESGNIEFYTAGTKRLTVTTGSIVANENINSSGSISASSGLYASNSGVTANSASSFPNHGFATLGKTGELSLFGSNPEIMFMESVSSFSDQWTYYIEMDNRNLLIKDGSGITTMMMDQNNHVGIGTSTATSLLSVGGDGTSGYLFSVEQAGSNNAVYAGSSGTSLYIKNSGSGQKYAIYARSESSNDISVAVNGVAVRSGSGTYYAGRFYDSGSGGTYMGLNADYRTGDAIDIAEYIYDTHGNTEPGDVVAADISIKESVVRSAEAFQVSVLGIVSTQPHMTMGADLVFDSLGVRIPGVQATRLALNGRVPCKVTDENGPIEPGDLITSSSTPGHAMKWSLLDVNEAKDFDELKSMIAENDRRRNAVIGKAVESHPSGTGKIMVLVSLQ